MTSRLFSKLRRVVDLARGHSIFDSRIYRESELARLANLFAHVDLDRWRGWSVLETGAGPGRLGDAFAALGFEVTATDGRTEHVERLIARGRRAMRLDLDHESLEKTGEHELILAFGVLYHLSEPEHFLHSCGRTARALLLETCVSDREDEVAPQIGERRGWASEDQALAAVGCRPSPAWVEATCLAAGFDRVRDVSSALANWPGSCFDWQPRDDGAWRRDGVNLRRMWVCEKTEAEPSREAS